MFSLFGASNLYAGEVTGQAAAACPRGHRNLDNVS